MKGRRFPPPWSIVDLGAAFVVKDSARHKLAYVYFEEGPGRGSTAKLLRKDKARRIAANFANYRLPTIYPYRVFAAEGGLMSYGVDVADLLRGAASYIDRILRGEKPNDLAVQQPTRFELVVNAKTAKMLGLTIPTSMLVAAEEVIE